MQVSLVGIGVETLLSDFDSVGIEYIRRSPSGLIMNAGETIQIIKDISDAIPWESLAAVIIGWLKYRQSRKITVTTFNNKILHIEGMSEKEFAGLLPSCKNLIAAETKKPNE